MLTTRPAVVVGVDGTSAGRRALEVALREATLRLCAVEVVTCWQPAPWHAEVMPEPPAEIYRRAQLDQEETVTAVLAGTSDRPVLSRRVIEGLAGPTLARLSHDAEFLIVGSHRKNLVERSILGSVSEHCIRHARCPVIVVPPDERATADNALESA